MTARNKIAELNLRRARGRLPVTDMYLGLHVGEMFYGNIGSTERLDFTVVGPAVNETSRIEAMCRSAEQPMLVSKAFADVEGMRRRLVSVGRYALRGGFATTRRVSRWIQARGVRACRTASRPADA